VRADADDHHVRPRHRGGGGRDAQSAALDEQIDFCGSGCTRRPRIPRAMIPRSTNATV
jgi:hypothetical protein